MIVGRDWLLAILVTLVIGVLGVSLGWYNNRVVPVNPSTLAHYNLEPGNPLKFMSNWDGPDYLAIAKSGYSSSVQANFFPLYPLVVRLVNVVLRSRLFSGLLVSWLSLTGAIYFYLKIIKVLFKVKDNLEALRAVLLFILFPTGIFLLATYTESLFAFFALGAIYFALNKKYLPAALLTALVTATHINGIFVAVLIGLIMLEQKQKITKIVSFVVVGCLGLLGYMAFLLNKFNNPLAFITAQREHGWLAHGISNLVPSIDLFNVIFIALLIVAIVYWWRRRKSFSIYCLLFLAIPVVGGQFGGFNRYVLMAFPLQWMIYDKFRHKNLIYSLVIALFGISWAYFMLQYAGGYTGG